MPRNLKQNSKGLAPVYLRVTVNGQRFETGTSHFIEMSKFQESGRAIGSAEEVKELNEFPDVLRAKAFCHTEAINEHWPTKVESPKSYLSGGAYLTLNRNILYHLNKKSSVRMQLGLPLFGLVYGPDFEINGKTLTKTNSYREE